MSNGWGWKAIRRLTHSLCTKRPIGILRFHDDRLYGWNVEDRRDLEIDHVRIEANSRLAVQIEPLHQPEPHSHDGPALDLVLAAEEIDHATHIVGGDQSQDLNLACTCVDRHLGKMGSEGQQGDILRRSAGTTAYDGVGVSGEDLSERDRFVFSS